MKLIIAIGALLTAVLLGGCKTLEYATVPEGVTEIRILIDGENRERIIRDEKAIEELVALISSLPPVKTEIFHGAVTYSTANTKRIEFVSRNIRAGEYFYVSPKTIRTQYATWSVDDETIEKINKIIANKTLQATAAIRPLFHHDPLKSNHPRNSNDSLGLVA